MPKGNKKLEELLVGLGALMGVKVNVEAQADKQESEQADDETEEQIAAPVTNAVAPAPADTATPPSPLAPAPAQNAEEPRLTQNEMQDIRGYINLMTEFGGPEGFKKLLSAMQEVNATQVTANKQVGDQKAALLAQLKANARCTLSENALSAMSVCDLTALNAALQPVNFSGQATGLTAANEQSALVAAPAPVLLATKK